MAEIGFHYFANCTNVGSVKVWGVVCGGLCLLWVFYVCLVLFVFLNEGSGLLEGCCPMSVPPSP